MIKNIRQATNDEWDYFVKISTDSTFYHTREWYEIWASVYGLNIETKIIQLEDGKTLLMPMSSTKLFKNLFTSYTSSPAGTYGGILSESALSAKSLSYIYSYLLKKYKTISIRQSPLAKEVDESIIVKRDFTHCLKLDLPFSDIFRSWSKGHKSSVKKAQKNDIQVKIAAYDSEWDEYYQLYLRSFKRWGDAARGLYDPELFREIRKLDKSKAKLWLATLGEQIVAGSLCFYHNSHVTYWHSAAHEDYFKFSPVNLLQYCIIEQACENGYEWYDFNPSGGLKGVESFKKSFNSQKVNANIIHSNSIFFKGMNKCLKFLKRLN